MRISSSLIAAAAAAVLSVSAAPAFAQGSACDRACLGDVMTRYLDSLVAHDPKVAPLADKVRFTEDTVETAIGEGFWKTATKLRPYRVDFLDVRQSTAAVLAVLEEGGKPVLFAARLKVANRRITEIETMVVRNAQEAMLFAPDSLKEKSVAMTTMPDKAKLTPREQMVEIALRYPAGLRAGSFVKADVPFGPGAYRLENGVKMAGPGCGFQPPSCEDIRNQGIPTLPEVKGHVVAVDEEAGLVLLRLDFGRGSLMGGGRGRGARAGGAPAVEQVLVTFEGFKIYDGKVQAIEAVFESMPHGASSGWDAAK